MRPTILTFHMTADRLAKLRFLCMKLGIALKDVPEEDAGQRISALCGLTPREDAPAAAPVPEEMIVLCHMNDGQVNRFLQTARQLRLAPVALKAVLTPTNAEWSPARLYAELRQERNAVLQGSSTVHDA